MDAANLTFADLPVDVIAEIAHQSIEMFRLMTRIHHKFGLWTIGQKCVNWFKMIDSRGATTLDGLYHSFDNQPALISDSERRWYQYGRLHRFNGPAIINNDYQAWYYEGNRHRSDGPAITRGPYHAWWIHGTPVKGPNDTPQKK